MPQFTVAQRTFFINVYLETHSFIVTKRRYRQQFPGGHQPSNSDISRWVAKFRIRGSVHNWNRHGSGRPRTATSQRNINMVRTALQQNPHISSRRNPLHHLNQSAFNRITQLDLKWHPYQIQVRHQLEQRDPQRRLTFCRWLVQRPVRMKPTFT